MRQNAILFVFSFINFFNKINGRPQICPGHRGWHQQGIAKHHHLPETAEFAGPGINDGDVFILPAIVPQNTVKHGHINTVVTVANRQMLDGANLTARFKQLKSRALRVCIQCHDIAALKTMPQKIRQIDSNRAFANTALYIPNTYRFCFVCSHVYP